MASGRSTSTFVRAYNDQAIARLQAHLEGFSESQLGRATLRARVAVIRKVQPLARRDVMERYGVRSSALNRKFRAVQGETRKGSQYIGIQASARRISLIEFKGRWRKGRRTAPASAEVMSGRRKQYDSAFIATVQGLKAIRVRRFKDGGTKRHGRGPLQMLRGPSPLEMLLGQDMRHTPVIAGKLVDVYQAEIGRQINLLRRRKR